MQGIPTLAKRIWQLKYEHVCLTILLKARKMCRKLDPSLSSHRFRAAPSIWADWAAGGWAAEAEAGRKGRRHLRQGATRKPRNEPKKRKLGFSKAIISKRIRFIKSIVKIRLGLHFSSQNIASLNCFPLNLFPLLCSAQGCEKKWKRFREKLL